MSDPLADWVQVTRPRGAVLAHSQLPARWGLAVDANPTAVAFHLVLRGGAWLCGVEPAPRWVGAGELVLLPRGPAHGLASGPEVPLTPLRVFEATPLPGPPVTRLLCGAYSGARSVEAGVWRGLPAVVHLGAAAVQREPRLQVVLELIAAELAAPEEGATPLVGHLLDALMLYALRAWARSSACGGGWLAGLSDPVLAAPLRRLHDAPEQPWTVASLARLGAVSRAVFAERFAARMGEPPMAYLRRWRMAVAAQLLSEGDEPVGEVARRVGYTSEYAFNRAFRRDFGQPPGQWRRAARA